MSSCLAKTMEPRRVPVLFVHVYTSVVYKMYFVNLLKVQAYARKRKWRVCFYTFLNVIDVDKCGNLLCFDNQYHRMYSEGWFEQQHLVSSRRYIYSGGAQYFPVIVPVGFAFRQLFDMCAHSVCIRFKGRTARRAHMARFMSPTRTKLKQCLAVPTDLSTRIRWKCHRIHQHT